MTAEEEQDEATPPGLLDNSVFIAQESGRPHGKIPSAAAISVATLAELQLGVLMADDLDIRAQRLQTLSAVESAFVALPADEAVARAFARIAAESRRLGRRPKVMEVWIAATAVAHGLDLYTQDRGVEDMPGVRVVHI